MKFDPEDILVCDTCGKNTIRRSRVQRYCTACSTANDAKRKPQTPRRQRTAELIEIGAAASEENRASVTWEVGEQMRQITRVSVPFSYGFSKNAIYSMAARTGHVYARKEANRLREDLRDKIAAHRVKWYEGKVWIDIFVEKPDARGDAINVVDLVCDAVKEAIGVDDRWFSIRRLDWSIVKENPRLIVGVGQAVEQHHRACSYCGCILPLTAENFYRSKSNKLGFGRECRGCVADLRTTRPDK